MAGEHTAPEARRRFSRVAASWGEQETKRNAALPLSAASLPRA
jgi:hypothetical protein